MTNDGYRSREMRQTILEHLDLASDIEDMVEESVKRYGAGHNGFVAYPIFLPKSLRSFTRAQIHDAVQWRLNRSRQIHTALLPGPFRSLSFKRPGLLPGVIWVDVMAQPPRR